MKFKTDENLPLTAADILRRAGHEAETVHDEDLAGEDDPRLAEVCRNCWCSPITKPTSDEGRRLGSTVSSLAA